MTSNNTVSVDLFTFMFCPMRRITLLDRVERKIIIRMRRRSTTCIYLVLYGVGHIVLNISSHGSTYFNNDLYNANVWIIQVNVYSVVLRKKCLHFSRNTL